MCIFLFSLRWGGKVWHSGVNVSSSIILLSAIFNKKSFLQKPNIIEITMWSPSSTDPWQKFAYRLNIIYVAKEKYFEHF